MSHKGLDQVDELTKTPNVLAKESSGEVRRGDVTGEAGVVRALAGLHDASELFVA